MLRSLYQLLSPERRDPLRYKYEIISPDKLGSGSYGLVYAGLNKVTSKKVAIKNIKNFDADTASIKQLLREVTLLRLLKEHPCIISLEDMILTTEDPFNGANLVFERYDTDLDKVIRSKQNLTSDHIQFFLYQIILGIHYIHSARVIHRDLKPSNILINSNCDIKICDFGLARPTHNIRETSLPASDDPPQIFRELTEYVVTRWYRSPEVILKCSGRGNPSLDMWSIGCILAELILCAPIFPGKSSKDVLRLIFDLMGTPEPQDREWIDDASSIDYVSKLPSKPSQGLAQQLNCTDASLVDLLAQLLELNPIRRVTAGHALQHSFFAPSYNSRDIQTFSLETRPEEEQRSFDAYYQFEHEFQNSTPSKSRKLMLEAHNLLQIESARYNESSSTVSFFASRVSALLADRSGKDQPDRGTCSSSDYVDYTGNNRDKSKRS